MLVNRKSRMSIISDTMSVEIGDVFPNMIPTTCWVCKGKEQNNLSG